MANQNNGSSQVLVSGPMNMLVTFRRTVST
jgi:hypothetical protein